MNPGRRSENISTNQNPCELSRRLIAVNGMRSTKHLLFFSILDFLHLLLATFQRFSKLNFIQFLFHKPLTVWLVSGVLVVTITKST